MDYESLTREQRDTYLAATMTTHRRRVELVILTLDDVPVRSLTDSLLGGAVHGDVTRTPAEILECRVLDVEGVLDWTNGQHRGHKLQVLDHRYIPELGWVEATVFTGPIWDFERRGAEVTIVAQGSERLAMGSVRRTFQRPRKARASEVIRDLLREAGAVGSVLRIPRLNARLPERVTVGVRRGKDRNEKKPGHQGPRARVLRVNTSDTYWPEAEKIAEAIDRELFTDGAGRFVLRPPQTKPSVSFTAATLTAPPVERRGDEGEQTNVWLVLGPEPKGPKERVKVEVTLPKRHSLSRESLAWHGKPREVTERVENKHVRTVRQAQTLGQRRRDKALRELVEYEIEAVPFVPWLRPNALVTIPLHGGQVARVRVKRWTLPLGPGPDPLVIGTNRRSGWR